MPTMDGLRIVSDGGNPYLLRLVLSVLLVFVGLGVLGHLAARRGWVATADLAFPPLPPDTGYIPPMAIIEDAVAISAFVSSSVDDVVEDAAKLMCLAGTVRFAATHGGRLGGGMLAASMSVLAMYQPCDWASDHLGDLTQAFLRPFLQWMGWPRRGGPWPMAGPPSGLLLDLADDVVEDAFKLACVWSHVRMGQVLTDSWAVPLLGSSGAIARATGHVVRLGVPAAKYNMCNEYGEFLGKWVHHHVSSLTGEV